MYNSICVLQNHAPEIKRNKKNPKSNFYAIPSNTFYFTGGGRGEESESVVPRVFIVVVARLDYQPLFGKMSPHSSPERGGEEEDQRPDPGDGGNRA